LEPATSISLADPIQLEPASSTSKPKAEFSNVSSSARLPDSVVGQKNRESAEKVQLQTASGKPSGRILGGSKGDDGKKPVARHDEVRKIVNRQHQMSLPGPSGSSSTVMRTNQASSPAPQSRSAAADSGKRADGYQCGAYEIGDKDS
jgi:hypothetical protein